jgi:hypothetical protein
VDETTGYGVQITDWLRKRNYVGRANTINILQITYSRKGSYVRTTLGILKGKSKVTPLQARLWPRGR